MADLAYWEIHIDGVLRHLSIGGPSADDRSYAGSRRSSYDNGLGPVRLGSFSPGSEIVSGCLDLPAHPV